MKKLFIVTFLLFFCLTAEGHRVNKPILGRQINWAHPLSKGLVGYWLMNEGSGNKVFDLSGNGNHGSLIADTHFVPGKFGPCLDFDGDGDYVRRASDKTTFPTNAITISAWQSTKVRVFGGALVSLGISGASTTGIWFGIDRNDGRIFFYVNGVGNNTGATGSAMTLNRWYHIAVTYDGSNIYYYRDGVQKDSDPDTGTISYTSNNIDIGIADASYAHNGSIDNVMIYNRALSASEIQQLYREPFAMFEPSYEIALFKSAVPGGVIKTLNGLPWASVKTYNGLAVGSIKNINGAAAQ